MGDLRDELPFGNVSFFRILFSCLQFFFGGFAIVDFEAELAIEAHLRPENQSGDKGSGDYTQGQPGQPLFQWLRSSPQTETGATI